VHTLSIPACAAADVAQLLWICAGHVGQGIFGAPRVDDPSDGFPCAEDRGSHNAGCVDRDMEQAH
ncbi:MAG: hypothetical protein ACREXP_20750, partial [Steroidobacteraceae bacterium]